MDKTEVLVGLESLICDRESLIMTEDDIFSYDKKVLQEAVNLIKNQMLCPCLWAADGSVGGKKKNPIAVNPILDYELDQCPNCQAPIMVRIKK